MTIGGLQTGNDHMKSEVMGAVRTAEDVVDDAISAFHAAKDKIDEVWGIYADAFGDEIASEGETAQNVQKLCEVAKEKIDEVIGKLTGIKDQDVPNILGVLQQIINDILTYIALVSGSAAS